MYRVTGAKMMTIKVVIADDHQLVREGFKRIIANAGDIEVMAEFANGEELQQQLPTLPCDVLLLDISMPGRSGVELIAAIRALLAQLPILVVSMHNDAQIVRRALQAGATGYIDKSCTTDILITAIRTVAAGARFIDPCLVDVLINDAVPASVPKHKHLSRREAEILDLIATGHSGSSIAEKLHLSPKTVSTHKKRLMQKLNVGSMAALMQYAIANDLVAR